MATGRLSSSTWTTTRGVALEIGLVVGAEGGDDDLVAGRGQVGGGAVDLHRPRAGLAVDHVGDEARAVVDVPDVDLLVGDQVGAGHQLGVDRDAADVVDVAVGDRRPVDLRLQHLPLHRSPLRRSGLDQDVVDQARGADLGGERDEDGTGVQLGDRLEALGVAGLEVLGLDAGRGEPRRPASSAGGQRAGRRRRARPPRAPARAPRRARGRAGRGRRCASSSPGRRPRARSAAPRSAPGSRGRATMRRITAACWASFWPK